jgi:hypothetical protein
MISPLRQPLLETISAYHTRIREVIYRRQYASIAGGITWNKAVTTLNTA